MVAKHQRQEGVKTLTAYQQPPNYAHVQQVQEQKLQEEYRKQQQLDAQRQREQREREIAAEIAERAVRTTQGK